MYEHFSGKPQISLWCDGREVDNEDELPPKKKKKDDKLSDKEDELETVFQKLKEKHGTEYSGPQLRLWGV